MSEINNTNKALGGITEIAYQGLQVAAPRVLKAAGGAYSIGLLNGAIQNGIQGTDFGNGVYNAFIVNAGSITFEQYAIMTGALMAYGILQDKIFSPVGNWIHDKFSSGTQKAEHRINVRNAKKAKGIRDQIASLEQQLNTFQS